MSFHQICRERPGRFRRRVAGALAGVALLAVASISQGQVTVETIGGGVRTECGATAGFVSGNTYDTAQFNSPVGAAVDSLKNLYIADAKNSDLEQITQAGDKTASETIQIVGIVSVTNKTTQKVSYQTNYHPFPGIVGVAVDSSDNVYVLTTNLLYELNQYLNVLNVESVNLGYGNATAVAVANDSATNVFVSYTNRLSGAIAVFNQPLTGAYRVIVSGYNFRPAGLAMRLDGQLAVSDTLSNAIYTVGTNTSSTPVLITGGAKGFQDGLAGYAMFDQPRGIAASSDGRMVVCDTMNNRLRVIDTNNVTTTLYGTDSTAWKATCCSCSPALYAGWVDGTAGISTNSAAGREPAGVAIDPTGTLFVTELYYNLIRSVTGSGLTQVTTVGSSPTNVPAPPTISPDYGYFPQCQTIAVTSSVPAVYYTIDGTTPTTNSVSVPLTFANGVYVGTFQWCNPNENLSQLKIISANGTNVSAVLTGQSSPANQLGFIRGPVAGVGSTAVIPLVIDLQSNVALESLQFRVEVTPNDANTPMIPSIGLLPISTNDFVPLVGPGLHNAPVAYDTFTYTTTSNGQGLVVSAAGNGSGLLIQNFAVAALLEVPIPYSAVPGQSYSLNVLYPSGTSDGSQNSVVINTLPSQTLTVADLSYFAGDSSPANGYDAGEFGDGTLENSDVNNALYASVGIRVPFPFTDAYNAMDVYPETANEIGDGFITFLDWQTILKRSLGLDTNNWIRFWTNGGFLSHEEISWTPGGTPVTPMPEDISRSKLSLNKPVPGLVWFCQASVGAGMATNLLPGNTCTLPVYAKVSAGYSLAGFQFRATVTANGDAPAVGAVQFSPAANIAAPLSLEGLSPNDIVQAWSLGSLTTPLQNSNYLGTITFQVPPSAAPGQSYSVHFSGVDGAADYTTSYQMESFPGTAWVLSSALQAPSVTSDEWKAAFFGSATNSLASDSVDADGDGAPNWQEYLAGTNPTNAASKFQFSNAGLNTGVGRNVVLNWLTAPGKTYILESIPAIGGGNWTSINTNTGDGNTYQFMQTNYSGPAQFYRIRLQP